MGEKLGNAMRNKNITTLDELLEKKYGKVGEEKRDKFEQEFEEFRQSVEAEVDMQNPREGWDEAFKQMHENGDDELLIPDIFEDEDLSEWT